MSLTIPDHAIDKMESGDIYDLLQHTEPETTDAEVEWYDDEGGRFTVTGHAVQVTEETILVWVTAEETGGKWGDCLDHATYTVDGDPLAVFARQLATNVAEKSGTLELVPPDCIEGQEHKWEPEQSGCAENPGVFGNGGGVIIVEICAHCGCKKITDTWADDGSGGHREEVRYEESE
jgi:hypothetical protein